MVGRLKGAPRLMVRVVLYLLLGIFLLSFLRSIIGILGKAFAGLMEPDSGKGTGARGSDAKMGGELKRDPVCGTFVSAATSVKKTVGKEVLHFCSPACREKYEQR